MAKKTENQKCYIRTFKFEGGKKVEYHSICDGKDYSDINNVMAKVTGKWARKQNKEEKIIETVDSVHYVK